MPPVRTVICDHTSPPAASSEKSSRMLPRAYLQTADNIFRELDQNNDGKIAKDEFKNALLVHGGLRKAVPLRQRLAALVPTSSWSSSWYVLVPNLFSLMDTRAVREEPAQGREQSYGDGCS